MTWENSLLFNILEEFERRIDSTVKISFGGKVYQVQSLYSFLVCLEFVFLHNSVLVNCIFPRMYPFWIIQFVDTLLYIVFPVLLLTFISDFIYWFSLFYSQAQSLLMSSSFKTFRALKRSVILFSKSLFHSFLWWYSLFPTHLDFTHSFLLHGTAASNVLALSCTLGPLGFNIHCLLSVCFSLSAC